MMQNTLFYKDKYAIIEGGIKLENVKFI